MKYISKDPEPQNFSASKAANPGATYKDLGKKSPAVKHQVHDALLKEQGYICCYCEQSISSLNSHIEHFRPKDANKFPHLQLDYTNLHTSCNKYPTKTTPDICGVKKDNEFSADLISPLEPDCSSHFKYKLNGTIDAATPGDKRAEYTISLLGLDDSFLDALRSATLLPFLSPTLTVDDLRIMKENYLKKKSDGSFNPFYTMIENLF